MTSPVTTNNAPTPLKVGRRATSVKAPKAPTVPKTLPVKRGK